MGPGEALLAVSLLSSALGLLCGAWTAERRARALRAFPGNLSLGCPLPAALDMPFLLLGKLRGRPPSGPSVYQAAGFLDTFLESNSVLSTAALNADRWLAVGFPLHHVCPDGLGVGTVIGLQRSPAHGSSTGEPTGPACSPGRRPAELHAAGFALLFPVLGLPWLKMLWVAQSHCRHFDVDTMQGLVLPCTCIPGSRPQIGIFIGSFVICLAAYIVTRLVKCVSFVTVSPPWGILSKYLSYGWAAADPCMDFPQVLAGIPIGC
uniref:LOW QUALITY PROTEIN: G-protein coupled receptor 78 n=1 Tax=Halichoerus grypus TaxID=9711 RepID=UPI0016591CDE|nr:LOW QUALITY PROTEIN: G-protein coupled receptor 78 [Halichoerus grypus]